MPSNGTYVCVPCRKVIRRDNWLVEWVTVTSRWKNYTSTKKVYRRYGTCPSCKGRMECMGNWSPPKKNNERAWKRIEQGDYLWDHRRRKRRGGFNWKHYRSNHSPDMGA